MKYFYLFFLMISFAQLSPAQQIFLKAELQGSQEVPANASPASGIVIVKYDMASNFLELTGDYQDLSAPISASHIHGPAGPGVNAPVIFGLTNTGGTTGSLSITATLTATQETDLLAGNWYVNVHNANFPGGEIRGQLTSTTPGQTLYFTGRIQGAQEVPPNGSLATGAVKALLDQGTGMVYLTGTFSGLVAPATASHLHAAAPNNNGPVFQNLVVTAATSGTIHVAAVVAPANQTSMATGFSYVNIHNANFPGGEIRGQLVRQSETVYLKAILEGSQEVPANASAGSGIVLVRFNSSTNVLELGGDYQNVSAPLTASHIHSPAPVGTNASVLASIANTGGTSGALSASVVLTMPQAADLLNGLMYVNVHNANFPGGELRGQLTTTSSAEQTLFLSGRFGGAQEVPANSSTATGNIAVMLDNITKQLYVTGNFLGLSVDASAAHIHTGATGTNGPVGLGLNVTPATAGTVNGTATISQALADNLILGLAYANIHNANFPGGEIRAQLGNLVLPVKLNYFNGFKQGANIALQWETAQELNSKYFEIEQQDALGKWISKGKVSAMGGSTLTKYNYIDQPINTGSKQLIYRLKILDADGQISFSPVIRINYTGQSASLLISPNPVAQNQVAYRITGFSSNKKAVVSVIDYMGRIVATETGNIYTNDKIDISKLPAGMYQLIIKVEDTILRQSFTK